MKPKRLEPPRTTLWLRRVAGVSFATVLAAGIGCSAATEPPTNGGGPQLLALSTYAASVGAPIDVYAAGVPATDLGRVQLHFQGVFDGDAGGSRPVDLAVSAKRIDAGTFRWTSFGPFGNPFTPTDPDVGVFRGTVRAEIVTSGAVAPTAGPPLTIAFRVLPSIVIEDLQPVSASCEAPATRIFGGFKYRLRARAIGFRAKTIRYRFTVPATKDDAQGRAHLLPDQAGKPAMVTTNIVHAPAADVDTIDKGEALLFPNIPEELAAYNAFFEIEATGAAGEAYASRFAIAASRPVEFVYDGSYQLAEIRAAVPVSACIPGGATGRTVQYTESQTETRARSLTIVLSESWMRSLSSATSKSVQNTWSTSDGRSVSRSRTDTSGWAYTSGTSTTNGTSSSNAFSLGYSEGESTGKTDTNGGSVTVSTEAGGKVGLPLVAEGELKVGGEATMSGSHADSTGTSKGWNAGSTSTNGKSSSTETSSSGTVSGSTATTDTTSTSQTQTKGGGTSDTTTDGQSDSKGGSRADGYAWTVSSADAIAKGFGGIVVSSTYGVFYRQTARYQRRALLVLYNKCGVGEVVGEASRDDWAWAPDLAQSPACPPLPTSNLPPAQCLVQPCN